MSALRNHGGTGQPPYPPVHQQTEEATILRAEQVNAEREAYLAHRRHSLKVGGWAFAALVLILVATPGGAPNTRDSVTRAQQECAKHGGMLWLDTKRRWMLSDTYDVRATCVAGYAKVEWSYEAKP